MRYPYWFNYEASTGWSFRECGGVVFAVNKHTLRVFRMYFDHLSRITDPDLSAAIVWRDAIISEAEARKISGFTGELQSAAEAAA